MVSAEEEVVSAAEVSAAEVSAAVVAAAVVAAAAAGDEGVAPSVLAAAPAAHPRGA